MHSVLVELERSRNPHCGLGQFSLHLGEALAASRPDDLRLSIMVPSPIHPRLRQISAGKISASVLNRGAMVPGVRQIVSLLQPRFDLWHATHQDTKFMPASPDTVLVLTIHDLNCLREKSPAAARRRVRAIQRRVNRSTAITTGSQFAAAEIREHLQIGDRPIHVIPHGVCLDRNTPAHPLDRPPQRQFLFTIGDVTRKKSFHTLVDMIHKLPQWDLVIAGANESEYARSLEKTVRKRGLTERVHFPGRVTDGQRNWLYENCVAFVFPSISEGFGLPIIEALSFGKPVFAMRCTSVPEVGGKSVSYWDSTDPAHMSQVLTSGLLAATIDPSFSIAAKQRAAEFNWPAAAQRYWDIYRQSLELARSTRHRAA